MQNFHQDYHAASKRLRKPERPAGYENVGDALSVLGYFGKREVAFLLPSGEEKVLLMEAGDSVVFTANTWHRGAFLVWFELTECM